MINKCFEKSGIMRNSSASGARSGQRDKHNAMNLHCIEVTETTIALNIMDTTRCKYNAIKHVVQQGSAREILLLASCKGQGIYK